MKNLTSDNKGFQEICYKGLLIHVEKECQKNILRLRTVVFSEKNFLPLIIRSCVETLCQKSGSHSTLVINEENLSVELVQNMRADSNFPLKKLIQLFAFSARSWALTLKRMAKNDLEPVSN